MIDVKPDIMSVVGMMDGGNSNTHLNIGGNSNVNKKRKYQQKIKSPSGGSGLLTAADMYEPGFRIKNAGLCTTHTRLLVLITSAAAPSHSQNRQGIRMTWMNRYGPSVSMAFLVGTPQMSEEDPVARVLEAEEQALKIRLSDFDINNNDKSKENPNPKPSIALGTGSMNILNGDSEWYQFLKDREPNLGEGLNSHAMNDLNEAERAVQRVLGREHVRYGDLIQCQSRDTYTNLTLKSIAALEWTRQYCPWARYLLKTDDDMFIDMHRLMRFIDNVETEAVKENGVSDLYPHPKKPLLVDPFETIGFEYMFESAPTSSFDIELPPTIWGRLAHGWRPIRQNSSKYYVSRTQYPGRVYPDFCTGPAYLMTRSTVGPLYEAALGRDFDIVDDDEDEVGDQENKCDDNKDQKDNNKLEKHCADHNHTLGSKSVKIAKNTEKNTVPYLKLEDVYLTGVVAERLTLRAAKRQARRELKKKTISKAESNASKKTSANEAVVDNERLDDTVKTNSKTTDIIVKIRRINDEQFANKKITGRALDKAVCSGGNSGSTGGTGGSSGFSWFRWYWGDTAVDENSKKKKKDKGVISIHMVNYFEQFDLWRRLMDGRIKCKT